MNDVAADEFTTSDSRPYLGYGMPWNHWTDMIPYACEKVTVPFSWFLPRRSMGVQRKIPGDGVGRRNVDPWGLPLIFLQPE